MHLKGPCIVVPHSLRCCICVHDTDVHSWSTCKGCGAEWGPACTGGPRSAVDHFAGRLDRAGDARPDNDSQSHIMHA